MTQDQILSQLKDYSQHRGRLLLFCKSHQLPYWKVWKFTNGEIKNLSMDAGTEISKAILSFNSSLEKENRECVSENC